MPKSALTPSQEESSDSSSSEKKPVKKAAPKKDAPKKDAKKKKSSSSSSSSSDSDSDSEEKKPVKNDKKRKAEEEADQPAAKKAKAEEKPAAAAGSGDNRRVFLGNLPFTIDDDKIREVFKAAGEITDIHWVTDKQTGKFYGTGFLEFSTADGAAAAVAMNGADVMGRPMKVDFAQPKGEKGAPRAGAAGAGKPFEKREQRPATPKPEGCTTVFLGNLSFQIDEDKVREAFADCGEISSVRWVERDGQFKGCGFVEFASSESTDAAVAKNGSDLLGRPVRVDYSAPKPKKF